MGLTSYISSHLEPLETDVGTLVDELPEVQYHCWEARGLIYLDLWMKRLFCEKDMVNRPDMVFDGCWVTLTLDDLERFGREMCVISFFPTTLDGLSGTQSYVDVITRLHDQSGLVCQYLQLVLAARHAILQGRYVRYWSVER